MKSILSFILVTFLLLSGCSLGKASDLNAYDSTSLQNELKNEAYQPNLPAQLPFQAENTNFEPTPTTGDTEAVYNFIFSGEGKSIELMTFNGKAIHMNMEMKKVDIGNLEGKYAEKKTEQSGETIKYLTWKQDGIVYKLTAAHKDSGKSISKEELIKTAGSFE
ncbi:DUF4367 domain-containing protein [Halobacillus rhizosphaerae]|uniref:DUF4367 domain-containing protein n=1 Tax=Halobacillus rhizosphaerae TaxID=3064889 RepID=UPI00398AA4DB